MLIAFALIVLGIASESEVHGDKVHIPIQDTGEYFVVDAYPSQIKKD